MQELKELKILGWKGRWQQIQKRLKVMRKKRQKILLLKNKIILKFKIAKLILKYWQKANQKFKHKFLHKKINNLYLKICKQLKSVMRLP